MEPPRYPPVFDAPVNGPTSPPVTPGGYSIPHFIHLTDPPPPYEKHASYKAPSPPFEYFEETTDPDHHFVFDRPRRYESLSRASSVSSPTQMDDESSADGSYSQSDEPSQSEDRTIVTVGDGDFDVEEVAEDDSAYDSHTEIVRPDGFEEASGAKDTRDASACDAGITGRFQELNCDDETVSSGDEQRRRFERRRKRWSGRPFKRTHSQSFGSETDDADLEGFEPQDDGATARRLRRRLNGGPGDRSSLIFEDLGSSHTLHEEQEHDDACSGSITRPSSVPPDEGLHALPFWVLQDPMEIDSSSSGPSSVA